MLTQTVTITQNSNPNIIIGRRSTYETQQVIFDISWLIETYGEGTAELLIKRPKDASAYPVVATLDGNTLTWTVSETDTQDKGHGECEIYWYVNGGLAKSCICGITILRDIGDTTETAPDPYETWVDELARLGAETLANAQAAEQSATSAAQSATEADNSAAAALESEENALDSENAAKASEQAAAASEQGAEQSATEAAQSASAAESSAANAQESADNASASADRAEQAAASIEGDTERAEAAARTAQGAASDASGFAGTASTKATEAAGSAATAEQAATTATQKAADASASETAAAGSASSASASATAAGNAQTAAETAQGKAEDAQEAAETAAQSIEDSAAQIDQNTEDILDLNSALNTKAGILRDTASGAIASFVPDSTIDNLLGVSVDIEPVQDLHGYDSPWPAGGGKNKIVTIDRTFTNNGVPCVCSAAEETVSLNGTATSSGGRTSKLTKDVVLPAGTYYFSVSAVEGTRQATYIVNRTDNNQYIVGYNGTFTLDEETAVYVGANVLIDTTYDEVVHLQIESGSTASTWTPYSNICPISGRDSAEVERTGKNILDFLSAFRALEGFTVSDDGVVKAPPSRFSNTSKIYLPDCLLGKTVTVSATITVPTPTTAMRILYISNGVTVARSQDVSAGQTGRVSVTFTHELPTDFVNFTYGNGGSGIASVEQMQLEIGSTASEYKPFAGTTYTIQLGETVYGGTLDITTGKLTVDRAMVDLGSLSWEYTKNYGFLASLRKAKLFSTNVSTIICSKYATTRYNINPPDFTIALGGWSLGWTLIVADSTFGTDATAFKNGSVGVQLCYELATPVVIDLDPVTIAAIAGQTNNVWADAGDVTVEYAADLKTYIDSKIAAAVAAMS